MPGNGRCWGGTQMRFSDDTDWWCGRPMPRPELSDIPMVGDVGSAVPAACQMHEVRRRDVGLQNYGTQTAPESLSMDADGNVTVNKHIHTSTAQTTRGPLHLLSGAPTHGFHPTADAVLFLRSEYLGSRQDPLPERYYSR
jgi:hypothetical protein